MSRFGRDLSWWKGEEVISPLEQAWLLFYEPFKKRKTILGSKEWVKSILLMLEYYPDRPPYNPWQELGKCPNPGLGFIKITQGKIFFNPKCWDFENAGRKFVKPSEVFYLYGLLKLLGMKLENIEETVEYLQKIQDKKTGLYRYVGYLNFMETRYACEAFALLGASPKFKKLLIDSLQTLQRKDGNFEKLRGHKTMYYELADIHDCVVSLRLLGEAIPYERECVELINSRQRPDGLFEGKNRPRWPKNEIMDTFRAVETLFFLENKPNNFDTCVKSLKLRLVLGMDLRRQPEFYPEKGGVIIKTGYLVTAEAYFIAKVLKLLGASIPSPEDLIKYLEKAWHPTWGGYRLDPLTLGGPVLDETYYAVWVLNELGVDFAEYLLQKGKGRA